MSTRVEPEIIEIASGGRDDISGDDRNLWSNFEQFIFTRRCVYCGESEGKASLVNGNLFVAFIKKFPRERKKWLGVHELLSGRCGSNPMPPSHSGRLFATAEKFPRRTSQPSLDIHRDSKSTVTQRVPRMPTKTARIFVLQLNTDMIPYHIPLQVHCKHRTDKSYFLKIWDKAPSPSTSLPGQTSLGLRRTLQFKRLERYFRTGIQHLYGS